MAENAAGEGGREGLFSALRNIAGTLLVIGRTRAELLVTELEEEKYRLVALWSRAIGAAFLLALGVIMAVFSLALAFWEQRVLLFAFFAVLFTGAALWLLHSLRQQARAPSRLFRHSLAELDVDIAQVRGQPRE